jgi:hypothetical protein
MPFHITYKSPGQRLAEGQPWGAISAGWYQSSARFFEYLVDQGLPETERVVRDPRPESAPDTLPPAQAAPWGWIALALAALVALSLSAPRHRVSSRSPRDALR